MKIDEYREARQIIDDLNNSLSFKPKRSTPSYYGDKRLEYLNSYIGKPKELGEEILKVLNNDLTREYYDLLDNYQKKESSDSLVRISDVFYSAAFRLHDIQYGKTPLDQREFEMYYSPQLYWAIEAAKQGNVEGFVREQRYLRLRGLDEIECPKDLIKAIQLKFAYEGDSDMQYDLYKRYDPSERQRWNGPAVNKEEKDPEKAAFWLDKLVHNDHIKLTDSRMLELIANQKTEQVEKAMKRAAEADNPWFYYTVAEYFGIDSDLGFSNHVKNAFSGEFYTSRSCEKILDYYKNHDDRETFKRFLMDWIQKRKTYNDWYELEDFYKRNYDLFKWLNEPEYDAQYLDYIINNANEFLSKSAAKLKKQRLKTSIFTGKVTRIYS